MRRLLVVLAVVVLAALFADTVFKNYVEGRAASELRAGLSLSDTPSVEIGGWPFSVHLLAQSFPVVDISGSDVEIDGIAVTRFQLELRDVDFSLSKLLGRNKRSIEV